MNGFNGNMNSQMMMDNIKNMVITMAMVKGANQTDGSNSIMNTIIIMLVVSFIDTIVIQLKKIFGIILSKVEHYIAAKSNSIPIITNLTNSYLKTKKATILIKIEPASKNPTSDAIIDTLTNLPHTKCILFNNGNYTINYSEEIEIYKGLYAKLVNNSSYQMESKAINNIDTNSSTISSSTSSSLTSSSTSPHTVALDIDGGPATDKNGLGYIDVYSYTLDMEQLRVEINNIVKSFLIKMTNKLGNNIYYFSEMPLTLYRDSNGKIDHSKTTENLQFTMKQFVTNRSFKNLFGKNIDIIQKRVEFFRDNKEWYDNKGVPYTLGILVSGNPGSGKTSIIKCIANELKRHIINIHLSDTMTKTQIENLFYNEQIYVTQNGKTETYTIPINKRIYVLEDVDCQCDVILDRGTENAEQILLNKNKALQEEVEKLKFALSEMASGKKMVMTGGNNVANHYDSKKDENANQKITLSFLLNLFDGVLETPGRITFMTTNFVDKLDKAFTRPGRIDVIGKFGFADYSQLIDIIEHRYDVTLTDEQKAIINNLHHCITPAEVGRILFENFDNLNGALEELTNFANECLNKEKIKEKERIEKERIEKERIEKELVEKEQKKIDEDSLSSVSTGSMNDATQIGNFNLSRCRLMKTSSSNEQITPFNFDTTHLSSLDKQFAPLMKQSSYGHYSICGESDNTDERKLKTYRDYSTIPAITQTSAYYTKE